MDGLLFLFGLLAVAWVLATPILLILHVKMSSKVTRLTERLEALEKGAKTVPDAPTPKPVAKVASEPVAKVSQDVAPPPASQKPEAIVSESPTEPPSVAGADVPPKAFVFRQDKITEFSNWLKENWVLAAGAASLSLAGIFLVQYGAERGLLTPVMRVISAIVFGAILMAGGEVIRRRFGDDDTDGATQFLPSALSGAGLLTLFAAVLSARVLYDLIGPGQAFAGLALVSAIGVVFGWFYGPVLTVVGILGATSAPYLIGGPSDTTWLLQYYFALIALAALAIDTLKRWAWVSVLALIATLSSIWFIFVGVGYPEHFIAAVLMVAAGAIMIPQRRLVPDHAGAPVLGVIWRVIPEFPTRLSFAVTLNAGAAALAVAMIGTNLADAYLGMLVMVVLMVATTLWMWRAPALTDHAVIPTLSFLALIATQALNSGPMYRTFADAVSRPPETSPPAIVWHLLIVAAVGSVLMFWRMPRASMPLIWAFAASSLAPVAVFLLEFLWDPAQVHGTYPWALSVIAVAGLMTLFAERAMRLEVQDKALIASLFAVAAISLIGMSLFLVLTKT
ncbi:MAG: DUF2339 domain-containing protein, partial [Silicimonas sp.]|nr:DUF2339 domain-containing protein [Silicimonas sp.]